MMLTTWFLNSNKIELGQIFNTPNQQGKFIYLKKKKSTTEIIFHKM